MIEKLPEQVFNIEPSLRNELLFDMFVDLLKCTRTINGVHYQDKKKLQQQLAKISSFTKTLADLELNDYDDLTKELVEFFFSNVSEYPVKCDKYKESILKDLKNGTAWSIKRINLNKIALKLGLQPNYTKEQIESAKTDFASPGEPTTRQYKFFETQIIAQNKTNLFQHISAHRDIVVHGMTFEDESGYLQNRYDPRVMINDNTIIELLFYMTTYWIETAKLNVAQNPNENFETKISNYKNSVSFTSFGLVGKERDKLSNKSKLEIQKLLKTIDTKPIVIALANQGHFVSAQIFKKDNKYEIHFFDGMKPFEESFAKEWVEDLQKHLKDSFGEDAVENQIVDNHVYVQYAMNCGLTSAIGAAYAYAKIHNPAAAAPQIGTIFEDLKTFSNAHPENNRRNWQRIPRTLIHYMQGIELDDQHYINKPEIGLAESIDDSFFFPETFYRMHVILTLGLLKQEFIANNPRLVSICNLPNPPLISTGILSQMYLFWNCLTNDEFYNKELEEYKSFTDTTHTAIKTKYQLEQDPQIIPTLGMLEFGLFAKSVEKAEQERIAAEAAQAETVEEPEVEQPEVQNEEEQEESFFSNSTALYLLTGAIVIAAVCIYRYEISFSSIFEAGKRMIDRL